jgi:hypothetical protein
MNKLWVLGLLCGTLALSGCSDDDDNVQSEPPGETIGQGGQAGADAPPIGAPDAEIIALDHETVITAVRGNITQHIDELDSSLNMIEDSGMLDTILGLFSGDEDAEDIAATDESPEEPGENSDASEDEGFEINLADIRDGILEIVTDSLLVEETATVSEDGKTITYAVSAMNLCANEPDEDEERSPEEMEEKLREFEDCAERLTANPINIEATSIGDGKINLGIAVGDSPADALRIQIHDDLVAGFIQLEAIKSIVGVFVSSEDLELPDTMTGEVGGEVRRLGESHFALRFAITEDIVITSAEAEAFKIELSAASAPGGITLDGPGKLIEGSLNLDTIQAELPWQDIVNLFYGGEEEVRTECFSNADDAESCRQVRDDCLPTGYDMRRECNNGCTTNPEASEEDRATCAQSCYDQFNANRSSCLEQLDGEVRSVTEALSNCMETISPDECGEDDSSCRQARCRERTPRYNEVCEHRDWCEEVREPAEEAPEVSGQLKIFLKAVSGALVFDGNTDTIELQNASLGDEAMTIKVEETQIIGVDVNPDNGRAFTLSMNSSAADNMRFEVSPLIDIRVALNLDHVWEAFVDEQNDLPDVLANDVLGIKFDGSETPTLDLLSENDETEMRVSSGQLTFSSPNMAQDVVIGEGMCMGSIDEDSLTDEERDAQHDLFGSLTEASCGL